MRGARSKSVPLSLRPTPNRLVPETARQRSEIRRATQHRSALHVQLYDRSIPVDDSEMLAQSMKIKVLTALAVFAAVACLTGNATTFVLFGFGSLVVLLLALGTTALPVVVGHLLFERILVAYKGLQLVVILVAVGLCAGGLLQLAEARRMMVDRATVQAVKQDSYVYDANNGNPSEQNSSSSDNTEAEVQRKVGMAVLLIMLAADVVLGYLVALVTKLRTEQDYVAWCELRVLSELLETCEKQLAELLALVEIAKKRCMAGILRAQNIRNKRTVPYHQALTTLLLLIVLAAPPCRAQTSEHYDGILIDTSRSIASRGHSNDLFRCYLRATKRILLAEPPNSRVWVSTIAADSFGGVQEVLKGWTPESRGIFTDELNRARHMLASRFETKASAMSPTASGTDIFGALWHYKALFESEPDASVAQVSKTIHIFSDMINETRDFPMREPITQDSTAMLNQAKKNGLMVPMSGYRIYVSGATTNGLTPREWVAVKTFWTAYFQAAGAELTAYAAECDEIAVMKP